MNRPLVFIALAAGLLRLGLLGVFHNLTTLHDDEREYDQIACNLVERNEFAVTPDNPTSIRPPLYPFFLATIYRVAGSSRIQAVRIAQIGLSLGTLFLVYGIGKVVYSEVVGLWAAALYGIYPSLLVYTNLFYTETLFTFFLCLSCFFFTKGIQSHSYSWFGLAGLSLALAALTRSVMWLFPPVVALYLFFFWRVPLSRRIFAVLTMFFCFLVPILPWAIRNTQLHKTLVIVDVMGGRNLMMGNYEHTELFRSWDAVSQSPERFWRTLVAKEHTPDEMATEGKVDKLALRMGIDYVLHHPGQTVARDIVKFFDFWGLERELIAGASRGYFGQLGWPGTILGALLILGAYAAIFISGIFGLIGAPPANGAHQGFLLVVMAFVTGMHTLVFAHSRYHLPLIPILMVCSARVLSEPRVITSVTHSIRFRFASVVCFLFGLAWIARVIIDWIHFRAI